MTRHSTDNRATAGRDLFKSKPKETASEQPTTSAKIQLGEHGRYQIKSGRLSGEYVARAFPKPPTNVRGLIAEARGETEEAAIAALHEMIDARDIRRSGDRRIELATGYSVPTIEEYTEALGQVAFSGPQRAMLTALALADEDGLSEGRLASAAGYKSKTSANRALASAGLLIASYLSSEATSICDEPEADGMSLLGYRGEKRNDTDPGNWILRTEVRDAVRDAF
ncbi:hypothetical protein [Litorisediminicola beolgyonensis]|uniref:Uncharacterized protein n=1 Tax=Litorisediminicola beolgyonensis TaxID=1173614 RepID=A0ABW3ZID6_9RHOB